MTLNLGFRVRAVAFTLFLILGIAAPLALAGSGPAYAAGSSATCTASNSAPVAAGTQVACSGAENDGSCSDVQNGVPTCAVRSFGNGLEYFALVVCVAGIFVSAALWAAGSKGSNPGQELTGKRGLFICLFAAFLVGAYPTLTTYFTNKANTMDRTGVVTATVPPPVAPGGGSSSAAAP